MLSKEISDLPFHIGCRISSDGEIGTVKFIGEIESQEGLWLGIEWDNPCRGKHNGTYKNVAYFQTNVANAGSFIRPLKADLGISCPEAIRRKYGEEDIEGVANSISLPQKGLHKKMVEMIGFEKVAGKLSQFQELTEVVVSLMNVNGPGDPGEVANLVPNIKSLDLSCNLFDSWTQIADIVTPLKNLQYLLLSKNHLKVESALQEEILPSLETLVLINMSYSWNDILTCAKMWPHVQNLYVCKNVISSLEVPPTPILANLRLLSLEENSIKSWNEILKLGSITTLQELIVSECNIESVEFPDVGPSKKTKNFPNLHSLTLSHNRLSAWVHIAELSKLQKLKDLRITFNPILSSVNVETARQLVIAKILGLDRLNRHEVAKSERRGAEFDYIKRYHRDWIQCGGHSDIAHCRPSQAFLEEHPTYFTLLQKHGAPEESEITVQTSLLKNNLLSIQIFSSMMPNKPPVMKKLPATMPICKVKGLVQRLFNVPAQAIKLMSFSNSDSQGMDMDNDLRQLSFYCLSDGDKIDVRW